MSLKVDTAEGKEVGFKLRDAEQTPGCIGDGLDEIALFFIGRFVFGEEAVDVPAVLLGILGGEQDGAAGAADGGESP